MKRKWSVLVGLALTFILLLALGVTAQDQGPATPPQSSAFGKTLAEWMKTYWDWKYGGVGTGQIGRVILLPFPNSEIVSGSYTYADPAIAVGSISVTLEPGTPIVLPVVAWLGESYDPSTGFPDDPVLPETIFTQPEGPMVVTVDGRTVWSPEATFIRDELSKRSVQRVHRSH